MRDLYGKKERRSAPPEDPFDLMPSAPLEDVQALGVGKHRSIDMRLVEQMARDSLAFRSVLNLLRGGAGRGSARALQVKALLREVASLSTEELQRAVELLRTIRTTTEDPFELEEDSPAEDTPDKEATNSYAQDPNDAWGSSSLTSGGDSW